MIQHMAESVLIDQESSTFLVDGKPFPWFISDDGPKPRRLGDDLYSVWVSILPVRYKSDELVTFEHRGLQGLHPSLDGIEFPWFITEEGFTYHARRGHFCTLDLAFLTRHVEANGVDIEDCRYSRPARVGELVIGVEDSTSVRDFTGQRWHRSKQAA